MKIARFSVERPVLTLMVSLIVLILGITALLRLPVDLMPDISYPTISITTIYSNTGPELIEQLITKPIEQAVSAVPGVEDLYSTSSEGQSQVRITFSWGTDLDAASNDLRDRIDRIISRVPEDAERPRLFKFDYSAYPIVFLGAYGSMDPLYLRELIDEQISYRLERVPGVAAEEVWGGDVRQIQVNIFPESLKALTLSVDQVIARIQSANIESRVGSVYRDTKQVSMRTAGLYTNLEDIRAVVVAVKDGIPIRLRQIATVDDTAAKVTRIARINGEKGIRLSVTKQSGKNTVEVAEAVVKEIENINRDYPQLKLAVLSDTSKYIKYSIYNVGSSAVYGGVLALVILLVFLRNVASSLVVAVTIPFSIIATFALMYFNGFTLNLMSLGALALGVGMLVDNSIVVLENISRLRETGLGAKAAAIDGSEEMASAVVASTLTTVVVFLPLIFVKGMAGVMYKQLAIIVSFSLLCSLLVALTLVPAIAARLHHPVFEESRTGKTLLGRIFHWCGVFFTMLETWYSGVLHRALDHKALVMITTAVFLGASLLLVPFIGSELMPVSDQGQVRINGDLEVGTRLEISDQKFNTLIEPGVVESIPESDNYFSIIGGGMGGASARSGQVNINLKPQSKRKRSDAAIAQDLRRKLASVPGITIRTRVGQNIMTFGASGTSADQLIVEIRGYDLAEADALALKVQRIAEKIEGITDARLSRESGTPEEHFIVDREKAADLNVTVSQISSTLKTVFAGTVASTFRQGGNEYDILVKMKGSENFGPQAVADLMVQNSAGKALSLSSLVKVLPTTGPMRIERRNQERIIRVELNLADRDIGSVAEEVTKKLREIALPRDFSFNLVGSFEEQQKSSREMLFSVILSLVLVYMVMACLYESFRDPFVVMFSVPLAAIGVLIVLFLTNTTFNIQTGIGALMLGGIVVNNAIVLVDHINLLRRRDGMELRAAIEESGRRRLRPILMTALTTIFGLFPLALGLGEGGEMQAPLARTVLGGLVSATAITLLIVPVVYYEFEHRRHKKAENGDGGSEHV